MNKYEIIILIGGRGKRVNKYTKKIPKCLIEFYGKPFLYYQLKYLKKLGIKKVILSTGYLSKKIKDYVKEKINFINVKVIKDGKKSLGTGGAVIKSINLLKNNFYILYGDSFLNFDLRKLKKKNNKSIMAIYKNRNKYDSSNVDLRKSNLIYYNKKKTNIHYQYIDYGVSYFKKSVFKNEKKNENIDLASILEKISKKNELKGYLVKKRFYEIGSYNGIKQFKKFIKNEIY